MYRDLGELEENCNILDGLNHDIIEDEVNKVIMHSKNGKAIRIENLPNEIVKNDSSILILTKYFAKMFHISIIQTLGKWL